MKTYEFPIDISSEDLINTVAKLHNSDFVIVINSSSLNKLRNKKDWVGRYLYDIDCNTLMSRNVVFDNTIEVDLLKIIEQKPLDTIIPA